MYTAINGGDSTVLDFGLYLNAPVSPWLCVILLLLGLLTIRVVLGSNLIQSLLGWIFLILGFIAVFSCTALMFYLKPYETKGDEPSWLAPHFSLTADSKGKPSNDESQRWKAPSGTLLDHCTTHETGDYSMSLHPFKGHYSLTCRDISTGKNVAITKNGSTQAIKEDK